MVGRLVRFAIYAAVTLSLTLWIGAQIAKVSFDDRYQLTGTFDDVTGLFAGDDVRLAGVKVGQVKSIKVVDGRAQVSISVNEAVELPVDTRVATRWLNLIGQRQMYLYPGKSTEMLADGDTIERTTSVVDLGELVNSLGPLAQAIDPDQLNEMFVALVEALEGNTDNLDTLVADLNTVVGTLAERDGTISQLVQDYETVTGALARRDTQIQTMVDNLVLLSQTFADNSALLDQALVEFAGFSTGLDAALTQNEDELASILQNLAVITGVAHAHLAELEQALLNLPGAVSDLFSATAGPIEGIWANVLCLWTEPVCPDLLMADAVSPRDDAFTAQASGAPQPLSPFGALPTPGPGPLDSNEALLALLVGGEG